jgi:hypothetical protein
VRWRCFARSLAIAIGVCFSEMLEKKSLFTVIDDAEAIKITGGLSSLKIKYRFNAKPLFKCRFNAKPFFKLRLIPMRLTPIAILLTHILQQPMFWRGKVVLL